MTLFTKTTHEYPVAGTKWKHRNGNEYTVTHIANLNTMDFDKYPLTVVYTGSDGYVWSRRADDWFRSFTPIPNPAT